MAVSRVADLVEGASEERRVLGIGDVELDDPGVPVRHVGRRSLIRITDAVGVDRGVERVHPLEGTDDGIAT